VAPGYRQFHAFHSHANVLRLTHLFQYDAPAQLANAAIPELSNVGNTAGGALAYNGTAYGDLSSASGVTVVVPSPEGAIGYSPLGTDAVGQPSWFPMSPFVFFDQTYICALCQANTVVPVPIVGPLPVSCSLQFTGVKYATGETVVQVLQFNPKPLLTPSPFACTTFPDTFNRLSSVSVQLLQAPTPEALTVVLFDNNTYTAYQKC
jgi:hypothetical protein